MLLQNDGVTVLLIASHTASRPSAPPPVRMACQLNVRNTIGDSVITNTIVERFAVRGPIGM